MVPLLFLVEVGQQGERVLEQFRRDEPGRMPRVERAELFALHGTSNGAGSASCVVRSGSHRVAMPARQS